MKRICLSILLILACIACLTACSDDVGTAEITTSKSGSVSVTLYDQTLPADKKSEKDGLTPLVTGATPEKSITDDANGLYRILTRTEGEGTLTTSTDKAKEGDTVTFTATPATDWRFVSVTVNGEIIQNNGTSFVMPASDANVVATFADMRHAVILGDHIVADNWGELRDDYYLTTAYTLVAGSRYEFTVDYNEVGHYYEDEDVVCRISETEQVDVTKVGDGRYSFVAPDSNCWVTVETHEYRHIDAVKVFTSSYDWGIYSEEDYTDAFTVSITVNGQPYTYGDLVKDGKTVSLTLSSAYGFTVKGINRDAGWSVPFQQRHNSIGQGHNSFGQSRNSYVFILDFSAQILGVDIEITGETVGQTYSVVCAQAEHGSVSANKSRAAAESTVTVTVTPDDGYVLNTLLYTTDGENYTDIPENNGTYSFAMPASDVTVRATFCEESSQSGLQLSATDYEMNNYDLVDVLAVIQRQDENFDWVSLGDVVNDMRIPVEPGETLSLRFALKEEFTLEGVYYLNDELDIHVGNYYMLLFDVDSDPGTLVFVVSRVY